ncbi:MAG: Glycosyl transferase group 1 [Parcubacteria group bacterium GW2011_GWA1_36_12]|nr:MAG: Glycosyl transferase group 1 [Parcubacteria group bacterium GW2011_GWA1_36_12]
MRICSPQLGLNPNSILGGEVFDREILLGLARKGIKAEIILPKGKPYDQNIKNWHIIILPIKHFPAILANLIFIPYFFKAYAEKPFSIIRLHSPRYLGLGALFFKLFKPKVGLIATYHQFKESNFGLISKIVNNLWNHIICDSQNVKNRLVKSYKLSPSKITVVHNGVPSYLKPAEKDKRLIKKLKLEGKITLLFMGLFIKRKNPLFLLDVLKNLRNKNVVLIFLGQGPLKSEIQKKAENLSIADQIRIFNPIYGQEKNKIHNIADIFVHPALDEGFALAPLEAMSCAKPIVITKGYSAAEAVDDGINGFLCNPNDYNYWVRRLSQLIYSSKLRDRMGKASLEKVKTEFQWRKAVKKHVKVFKNLVE